MRRTGLVSEIGSSRYWNVNGLRPSTPSAIFRISGLVSILLLGVAAACAVNGPAGPVEVTAREASADDFMPLAVGMTWVYEDYSPQLASSAKNNERTVRILRRDSEGYYHDSQRGQLRFTDGCLHDRLRRLLCDPIEKGTKWVSVVSTTSTERYEIVSTNERVQTPTRLFEHCVKVRATNRAGPDTEHVLETIYAPGVGMVQIETFIAVKGVLAPQVRARLKSFRLRRK